MKKSRNNKIALVLVGLVLLSLFFRHSTSSAPNLSQNLGTVTRGDLIQRVTISGLIAPNRKTLISAPYAGYVRKIYVKIGQKVEAGDPIVSVAQSLKGGEEDIYPLRAPFPGTVVQVLKTEGEYVDASAGNSSGNSNALVRVDDLHQIFVESNSPETEIRKLKVGQAAIIKASAILNRTFHGKIVRISLASREESGMFDRSKVEFPLLIELSDQDEQLEPGMSAIVDIITNKRTGVLTLGHEFILTENEKSYVTTETGEKREVQLGMQDEEGVEILQGVTEGEKLRQTDFLSALKEGM